MSVVQVFRTLPDRQWKSKFQDKKKVEKPKILSRKEIGLVAEIALSKFPDSKISQRNVRTQVSKGWKDKFIERNKPLNEYINKSKKDFNTAQLKKFVSQNIVSSVLKDYL